MKKSLTLALAMALGITASAYAANPFSDVPAGHWAYGSIAKLAAAGVIDGYPDGTFQGQVEVPPSQPGQCALLVGCTSEAGSDEMRVVIGA